MAYSGILNKTERDHKLVEDYLPILKKCPLFRNIPEMYFTEALECLEYSFCSADDGERILSVGDDFRYAYFLLEGEMASSFLSESEEKVTLNHFYAGSLMGEALAVMPESKSMIDLEALTESAYLTLNLRVLLSGPCKFKYHHLLLVNLLEALAGQNYFLNQKVRMLGQKSIRDRLSLYFSTLPVNSRGYRMIPYTRTELAAFLGLNRSAMVRELGKMAKEGVIDLNRNQVRVNNKAE